MTIDEELTLLRELVWMARPYVPRDQQDWHDRSLLVQPTADEWRRQRLITSPPTSAYTRQ